MSQLQEIPSHCPVPPEPELQNYMTMDQRANYTHLFYAGYEGYVGGRGREHF